MRSKIAYLLSTWGPVLLWMAVIYMFSSRPTVAASTFDYLDFVIKKTAHVSEYAILFAILMRAIYKTWGHTVSADLSENASIIVATMYAVSDEWHQSFVSGRTATLRDVLIDFIGILIGLSFVKLIRDNKKLFGIRKLIYGTKKV